MTNEGFGSEHFIRHHLQRFLDPAHHERPFWYYVPSLFLELLPWPLLLVALCQRWRSWTGTERFLMFFSMLCFIFFSIAKAKLPTYLLPMLPTMAVLFGKQLLLSASLLATEQRLRWGILMTSFVILIAVSFRSYGFQWALKEGTPSVDFWVLTAACLIALIMAGVYFRRIEVFSPWNRLRWGFTILVAGIVTLSITHRAIPDYAQLVSVVEPCQQLINLADKEGIPYVAHRNSWDAVSFMLGQEELEVFSSREVPAFFSWINTHARCMIWMRDYENRIEAFTKTLPAGVEVEKVYDLGRVQALILRQTTQVSSTNPR